MADEVNYVSNWPDEATQCKNCANFQSQDGKKVCVPKDKTFKQALEEYGEVDETGHCDFWQAK